ncbi:HWE histidine kinase domain-containing protein [Phenylobacterium aquaticum]|uniref:HWE histidine kinase domain-containing protein n=1 Tax=Phenylobacterium aquaticum TaxID=1763816 RepID=UPI0026F2493B|nr:HWE histidine kinase domain-containing protein [Phenylobacterium aquaticum]
MAASEVDGDLTILRGAPQEDDAHYRIIFDTAVEAIVVFDEAGAIRTFNPAAERLFGYGGEEMAGRNLRDLMAPPYRDAQVRGPQEDQAAGVRRILGAGQAMAGQRKNGSTFTLELSMAEWRRDGERFFTGVMRDVTDDVRVRDLQRLMVNELNHRVKNTLATVQAIVSQTLRDAESPQTAQKDLIKRLVALAAAHDILTRESWEGAQVAELVAAALETHGVRRAATVSGPDIRLAPKPAVALALALHELMTNAAKFGALSVAGGVNISWEASTATGLVLTWREQGGPAVEPPTRRGFGLRMIEALAADLGGRVDLSFEPEGLVCVIHAELGAGVAAS